MTFVLSSTSICSFVHFAAGVDFMSCQINSIKVSKKSIAIALEFNIRASDLFHDEDRLKTCL